MNIEIDQLLRLLSFDDLNISSEQIVLKCVKRWIEHKETERVKHAVSLYELIKLPFIPADVRTIHNFIYYSFLVYTFLQLFYFNTIMKILDFI